MVIDYKGTKFSFDKVRKMKRTKRIKLAGLLLGLVLLYLLIANFIDSGKIDSIRDQLLDGKYNEAAAAFEDTGFFFHKESKKELKALLHLYAGQYDDARLILSELAAPPPSETADKFLAYFSDRALYRSLGVYTDYLLKGFDDLEGDKKDRLLFYRAQVETALLDHQQSTRAISQLSAGFTKENQKALALLEQINRQVKSGTIDYIFDTDNKPLAYYDTRKKKTVSRVQGIDFDDFTPHIRDGIKFYSLTLDSRAQDILHRRFRNFHGSFLLFNLNSGSIAAAYSKPIGGGAGNAVFSQLYEPGSIIKLLTLFAYLRAGHKGLFPFDCTGRWEIEGKTFHDWTTHRRVEDHNEALAVSCNLVFAQMGLQVGFKNLSSTFEKFYFNSGGMADLFIEFKTGTFNKDLTGDYRLARLAEGLDELSITTFHAALLAELIAQNGAIYSPHLVKNKKNLLKIGFYNHSPQLREGLKENFVFHKIKEAMIRVVDAHNGTGRRARSDKFAIALKTGTAGDKKVGLDAVLAGFFPADKPEYAFAFRLERAGKAEWKGALFLKDFLNDFFK